MSVSSAAPAATAPFLAATAVLAVAGVAKLWRPDDTAGALRAAGLRFALRPAVRVMALAEVALAVAAVLSPGPLTGALVATAYAAFAAFVLVALLRGWPLASCGCFGRPDSKPGYTHALLDTGAAAMAAWWALSSGHAPALASGGFGRLFSSQAWHGAPLCLLSAVIAGLAYVIWTNPVSKEIA